MDVLATMTADEYRATIRRLGLEGLRDRTDPVGELLANARAEELLAEHRSM